MVDWPAVGTGALWVTGLAIMLAVASRALWRGRQQGHGLPAVAPSPGTQLALDAGLTLPSAGLCLTVDGLWMRLGRVVVDLLWAMQVGQGWRNGAPSPARGPTLIVGRGPVPIFGWATVPIVDGAPAPPWLGCGGPAPGWPATWPLSGGRT